MANNSLQMQAAYREVFMQSAAGRKVFNDLLSRTMLLSPVGPNEAQASGTSHAYANGRRAIGVDLLMMCQVDLSGALVPSSSEISRPDIDFEE